MSWITDELRKRLDALEAKIAPGPAAQVADLEKRIAELEAKAAAVPPELTGEEGEIGALTQRVSALEIIVGNISADMIAHASAPAKAAHSVTAAPASATDPTKVA